MERLRKEITAPAARMSAEREAACLQSGCCAAHRARPWLKSEELNTPNTPLPPASDELATSLAEYVARLGEKLRGLEAAVQAKEQSVAQVEGQAEAAPRS